MLLDIVVFHSVSYMALLKVSSFKCFKMSNLLPALPTSKLPVGSPVNVDQAVD